MRISDWSSDVCSSDLARGLVYQGTRVLTLASRVPRYTPLRGALGMNGGESRNPSIAVHPECRTRQRAVYRGGSAVVSRQPQVFGSVTPRWPWYLPPLSAYEVSQTSSDS